MNDEDDYYSQAHEAHVAAQQAYHGGVWGLGSAPEPEGRRQRRGFDDLARGRSAHKS